MSRDVRTPPRTRTRAPPARSMSEARRTTWEPGRPGPRCSGGGARRSRKPRSSLFSRGTMALGRSSAALGPGRVKKGEAAVEPRVPWLVSAGRWSPPPHPALSCVSKFGAWQRQPTINRPTCLAPVGHHRVHTPRIQEPRAGVTVTGVLVVAFPAAGCPKQPGMEGFVRWRLDRLDTSSCASSAHARPHLPAADLPASTHTHRVHVHGTAWQLWHRG